MGQSAKALVFINREFQNSSKKVKTFSWQRTVTLLGGHLWNFISVYILILYFSSWNFK